jgi:hypothetical protein
MAVFGITIQDGTSRAFSTPSSTSASRSCEEPSLGRATMNCGEPRLTFGSSWLSCRQRSLEQIRRIAIVSVAVALVASAPSRGHAQTFTELERTVLPFGSTLHYDDADLKLDRSELTHAKQRYKDFWDGLKELRSQEAKERALTGAISVGFSGDSTGRTAGSLYKINLSGEVSRGTHPAELRFLANVTSQIKDGKSAEDSSRYSLSYEYDVEPHEIYAFAERTSDSYLGIDSRYEAGVGWKFHKILAKRQPAEVKRIRRFFKVLPKIAMVLPDVHTQPTLAPITTEAGRKTLKSKAQPILQAIQERIAQFEVDLAVSVFSEFEQAHVTSDVTVDGALLEDRAIAAAAEQLFRFSLRPGLHWRPATWIHLSVLPYFKGPLFGDWTRTRNGDSRLDYRWDIFTELTTKLGTEETGSERVSLVLKYDYHYDNFPPTFSMTKAASQISGTTIQILSPIGPSTHHAVSVNFRVDWGG